MSYTDQLNRVKRYLARIENQSRDSTEYDDDLWSFFQNCWHLKDWVKNDPAVAAALRRGLRRGVKGILKGYSNIIVCADLANRTKHLTLKRRWVGAKFTQRNVTVRLGRPTTSTSEHIVTLDDGTKVVALDVARRAVEEWHAFFKAHGLPIRGRRP